MSNSVLCSFKSVRGRVAPSAGKSPKHWQGSRTEDNFEHHIGSQISHWCDAQVMVKPQLRANASAFPLRDDVISEFAIEVM